MWVCVKLCVQYFVQELKVCTSYGYVYHEGNMMKTIELVDYNDQWLQTDVDGMNCLKESDNTP